MSITVVGSPPYAESLHLNESVEADIARMVRNGVPVTGGAQSRTPVAAHHANQGYGLTPGQLGALPSGALAVSHDPAPPVPVTTWQGCYGDSWQDLIVPEAFAHPAKFARGLIHRIYRHLLEQGYVGPGTVVLDPFGGVALGALDALTYGLRYVGVELEPRFVALGQQNLDVWRQRYGFTGGTIVQGDSRRLREVLAGAQVQAVVGSPPYAESLNSAHNGIDRQKSIVPGGTRMSRGVPPETSYGTTPGQLGAMPPGALVSSPPYAGAGEVLGTHNGIDWSKAQDGGKVATPARQASGEGYGTSAGQLGNMAMVSSPPYADLPPFQGTGTIDTPPRPGDVRQARRTGPLRGYGTSTGQLGAMPPGAVVSSPPWGHSQEGASVAGPSSGMWKGYDPSLRPSEAGPIYMSSQEHYGTSPGQLGAEPTTFWEASAQIMQELALLLPAGAVCAWVVKPYIKNKKIVPFDKQWQSLCEAHGFHTVEIIHASLIEHHGVQETFFGESEAIQTARKSFFRRLCEKKGSPSIDVEVVLIMQKSGRP